MFKNNIAKYSMLCGIFFLLFYFGQAQAQHSDEYNIRICNFYGLEPNSSLWEANEFAIFLEEGEAPGYSIITKMLGRIAFADSNTLKSSACKISRYLGALIKFYDKNKEIIQKKHKNIADLIELIRSKFEEE